MRRNYKILRKALWGLAICSVLAFTSCASVQRQTDTLLFEENNVNDAFEESLLRNLVPEDAAFFEGKKVNSEILDNIINQIKNKVSEENLQKTLGARLLAIQGRAYLLKGQKDNAVKCLSEAEKKYSGDIQAAILSNRLNKNLPAQNGDNALLILEEALGLFESASFDQAAASFDTAFLNLPPFYKNAYASLREKAWSLKDTASASSESSDILKKSQITLAQMLDLTQKESDVLDFYTGGKNLSTAKLFERAMEGGLFEPATTGGAAGLGTAGDAAGTSAAGYEPVATVGAAEGYEVAGSAGAAGFGKGVAGATVTSPAAGSEALSSDTLLSRVLLARYLWNILTRQGANKNLKNRYSQAYAKRPNAKSPVADIPLDSPDFDAVLGCVEKEIMALPDGRNFQPDRTVSGAELYDSLKKLK